MKTIIRKLVPFLLAFAVMLSVASFTRAESTGAYVLMNIPYADFYAAEVSDVSSIDAVSSSTLMKPRTGGLAGGSYHVDAAGSDISGVIFPVYVEDVSVLPVLGGTEIKDDSKVEITVTNKGEEKTTVYEGKEALFEAPDYSWYVLTETPVQFKTLSVENGKPTFSAVNTEAERVNISARLFFDKHTDQAIRLEGIEDVLGDQQVSAIILIADDGTRVGLRHIANIWRGLQIGFRFDSAEYAALAGKTIISVEYLTKEKHYIFDTDVKISSDQRLAAISDTYIELFPEFAKEENKDWWIECIKAYPLDDETAEVYYTMLTQQFLGRKYGQEAIDAFSSNPAEMAFDCFFENGIVKIMINGNEISAVDAEGKQLFCHNYTYVEDAAVSYMGQEMPAALHIYKTDDPDAGIFTYFAFSDDLPGETQHIEFRYGETLDNIGNYSEGVYAYWLAAGIQDGYSEKLIKACIKLFVDENVGEQFAEPAAEETAQNAEVIEISSAEELMAVNQNLSGHYVLTADIDLSGQEWTPIGAYAPSGESEEEQEIPSADYAFTGSFDGRGHTISNLVINQPEGWALGLFGCVANAEISNFTLENASVDGSVMAADVVGYTYCSMISNVKLINGKVTVHYTEMSAEGMYGGIAGAGNGSLITDCEAQADIVIPDNTANTGIIGGGLQMTSVVRCRATGSVAAGNNCYGLGGISGCGFASEQFTDCTAENVVITAGDNCFWIGGITGYTGGYAVKELGIPVTVLTNCNVLNVTVTAGENATGIGDIVGSGFFSEQMAANGAPFDQPTQFELVNCNADPAIVVISAE